MTTIQKVAAGAGVGVLMLASQFYGDWSARNRADERAAELSAEIQSVREADAARIAELTMELDMMQGRMGITAADIKSAQQAATAARQEQNRTVASLRKTIDEQNRTMNSIREESGAQINEVRTQTSSQLGQVNDEVNLVKTDLTSVRKETTSQFGVVNTEVGNVKTDLNATRSDLAASRQEMSSMRDSLGRQIAHNAEELAVLKRRGERDYFEFDLAKSKQLERIGGVLVQLNKTDTKARKYDMTLQINDDKVQKKGNLVNEPVQFYVGKQRLRYELVVNSVDKDRIRGYLSKPKDGANETPVALK
jgi:hypothetical protein